MIIVNIAAGCCGVWYWMSENNQVFPIQTHKKIDIYLYSVNIYHSVYLIQREN